MAWMSNLSFCFEVLRSTLLRKHPSSPVDVDIERTLRFKRRDQAGPEISCRSMEVVVVVVSSQLTKLLADVWATGVPVSYFDR